MTLSIKSTLTDDQYRIVVLWRCLRVLAQRCQQNEGLENYQKIGLDAIISSVHQVGSLTDSECCQIYADVMSAISFR